MGVKFTPEMLNPYRCFLEQYSIDMFIYRYPLSYHPEYFYIQITIINNILYAIDCFSIYWYLRTFYI